MAYRIKQIAEEYQSICEQLPDIINEAGLKQTQVYTTLGLSRTAWTYRLRNKIWTPEQLIKIATLLKRSDEPV